MDGYSLTEKMRKARRSCRFTAVEQALFYELVAICNGENWATVFDCSNIELCYALDITEKTLIKARESLLNAGILFYKSGKSRRVVGKYSFIQDLNKTTVKNTANSTAVGIANSTAVGIANSTDLYKGKTETKTISLKGENRFVFESLNPLMEELLNDPVIIEDFQRSIGSPYPPPETVKDLIKEFFVKLTVDGEESKDRKNAIYHFKSWYRQNLESKNKRLTYEQTQKTGSTSGFKLVR